MNNTKLQLVDLDTREDRKIVLENRQRLLSSIREDKQKAYNARAKNYYMLYFDDNPLEDDDKSSLRQNEISQPQLSTGSLKTVPQTTNKKIQQEIKLDSINHNTKIDRKAELERKQILLAASREERKLRIREKERKHLEETSLYFGVSDEREKKKGSTSILSQIDSKLSSSSCTESLDVPIGNEQSISRKFLPNLSVSIVQKVSISAKEVVESTKQTQTIDLERRRPAVMKARDIRAKKYYTLYFDGPPSEDDEESSAKYLNNFRSKSSLNASRKFEKSIQVTAALQKKEKDEELKEPIKVLCNEQKQSIMLSEEFRQFIIHTGRIIERALCEISDIHTDYIGEAYNKTANNERINTSLQLNRTFYCENMTQNRCITSMDWSKYFPELVVASYHNEYENTKDLNGVVIVWNTKYKKSTPEDIFHCQSAVMTTCFAKFNPNLIIGGTYSGQIVLWDNRVQKRTPVQSSIISAAAHTHPIYCLQMVGTQNLNDVISISSDGKLCSWNLDMLSKPQFSTCLDPISATCMTFPTNEIYNFVIGAEDGYAYSASRKGSRVYIENVYEKHLGPITGISARHNEYSSDFNNLFLTSSMDWTIKLWSMNENRPLYSFEYTSNYIMDIKWSPIHPAIFACVDESGHLDLWNINQNVDVPIASTIVNKSVALNCVSWSSSGLHVTAGDDSGKLYVYDVNENLGHPKANELNKLNETLYELKLNKND
ncbi:cytoplasmic dynein 1 intermediate chain-like, partial [Condylostylus longicornis]|uniref:cytoplasmic dynein 1 intermediate chain-like n=1 Tax=Condylostylus longicornis TaxID=2530218 RepID=UPI00244DA297